MRKLLALDNIIAWLCLHILLLAIAEYLDILDFEVCTVIATVMAVLLAKVLEKENKK